MKDNEQAPVSFAPLILARLGLESKHLSYRSDLSVLMSALHHEEWPKRVWAVREYERQAEESELSLEPLIPALNDPAWQVRATTIFALAGHCTQVPQSIFLSALDDEEETIRAAAVRAIGMLGEQAPIDALIAATGDPAWLVREVAILALRERREQAPVFPLITALNDEDGRVREAALLALRECHPSIESPFVSQSTASTGQQIDSLPLWEGALPEEKRGQKKMRADSQMSRTTEVALKNQHSLQRSFAAPRKRFSWRTLESGIAALLLISLLFSWIALTQHLHFLSADTQRPQSAETQTILPPVQPGKILFTYQGQGRVFNGDWTADSRYLGFSSDNASTPGQYVNGGEHIHIWDAVTDKMTETFTLPSLPTNAQGVFSFGANRYLDLMSNQGLLQIWDYVSSRKLLDITSPGAQGWPNWIWSDDQKWLAVTNQNGSRIEIWNIAQGSKVAEYAAPVSAIVSLRWSPDDRYLAATSNNRELAVWDALTGRVVFYVPPYYDGASLFWSPNSQQILVNRPAEAQMQLWDIHAGKVLVTFPSTATRAQWTPDGTHILAYERNKWVVWDAHTGRAILTLPISSSTWAAASPDNMHFALMIGGNNIQIWDTTTGRQTLTYPGYSGGSHILAASWSFDNHTLAVLENNGILLILDDLTGKTLARYHIPLLPTPSLIWSPDARFLALASQQPMLEIVKINM